MAINVSQAFKRTSANPIDESLFLSKVQMLVVDDNLQPSKWFTICADDGFIYLYDKTNTADPSTGKFRKFEGGSSGASELDDLEDVLLTSLANGQTLAWDSTAEKWVNVTPDKSVELTQAEYNQLSPAEQMNGTTYFITDGEGGGTYSVLKETLQAGTTTVTFAIPTSGDYISNIYTSDGRNYLDATVATGSLTLTFEAPSTDITVFCEIKGV